MMHPAQQQPMPMGAVPVGGGAMVAPTVGAWMVRPEPMPGCPPGLEYLTQVDQLLVQQQPELLEAFTGWETCNKYRVFNIMGQQCYYAFEESSWCMRLCCGTQRAFIIHIVDNMNKEVIRVSREYRCCACSGIWGCCDCCNYEITVEAPPGVPIGYARSECYCCSPQFVILDANRSRVMHVEGPCKCMPRCCGDHNFDVSTVGSDSAKIGRISKKWSGFVREAFTDADNFGVTFPRDLDVGMKATMLGVLFLIDFMFFEESGGSRKKHHGGSHHH